MSSLLALLFLPFLFATKAEKELHRPPGIDAAGWKKALDGDPAGMASAGDAWQETAEAKEGPFPEDWEAHAVFW